MKKVIAFLMIFLISIYCAFAFASPDFSGTWFYELEMSGPYYCYDLLHLFINGTGYFSSNIVDSGVVDEEPVNILISWEPCDIGLRVQFPGGYRDYQLLDDGRLSDGQSFAPTVFSKLNGDAPYSAPGNTLTVPSGVYIAGDDFPAGNYRIELENEENSGVIVLYENMEDTKKSFSYLHEYTMNKRSPIVGKMVIEEGNVLDVRGTTIILMPYEGLK